MLEAGWYQFNQEYFRLSVQLAAKELEVLESRFSSLIVVATILVGFAFTALVELDVNTASLEALEEAGFDWMEDVYYVCVAVTIAFNLFVLFVSPLEDARTRNNPTPTQEDPGAHLLPLCTDRSRRWALSRGSEWLCTGTWTCRSSSLRCKRASASLQA